MNQHH